MSYGLLLKMEDLIMLFLFTLRSTKFLLSSNLCSKLKKIDLRQILNSEGTLYLSVQN